MVANGSKLGPYEILGSLGAGGMGEVYRARDTKLNRDVAIKLLPADVALDQDRLARFKREAQVLASLNHSNIGAIYGFEDSAGSPALILELVEGPTLADRIAEGPVPIDEALSIARQISDALDAAHEQGIVHRDLKPANVKLRADGTVKVLDFGLAKAVDPAPASGVGITASPAMTSPTMTRMGVILGTAAYMSPEQARGKAVDKRSDVWAFGCVLYEMLTGEQLFRGETITDVLAAVVSSQPDFARVLPPVRRLLRGCLEKEPKRRVQAITDVWLLLEESAQTSQPAHHTSWLAWVAIPSAVIVAVIATVLWMRSHQPVIEKRSLQFQVNLPPGASLNEGSGGGSAISPDGRAIVFAGRSGGLRRLWIRRLDSLTYRELPGSTGGDFPFWSPDGRFVAFFADGKLKRIDASGGSPIVVAEAPTGRGGAWGADGTIIFALSAGVLRQVPAAGGAATPLTTLDLANGENADRWPQFLPDGRRFLFWVRSSKPNRTGVYISSLDRPKEKTLVVQNPTAGAYSPGHDGSEGHLLWVRDNQLFAQRFDPARAQLSGEPTAIQGTGGVGVSLIIQRASFSVSQEATLLYTAGAEDYVDLTWFDRAGRVVSTVGKPERYAALRISPSSTRVAMSLYDASTARDIWTMDLARGLPNRVTTDGGFVPVWSPDGRRIAYHDSTQTKLFTIAADGGDRQLVLDVQEPAYINDWSPDGQWLMYTKISNETNDLWIVPIAGDRKPVPWQVTPFNESHGQYSPDGKWVAFTSEDSGQQEIYVRSFVARERTRVSTSGGSFARWRADGKELFYRALDGRLMAAPVSLGAGGLEFGPPVALMDIVEPLGTYAYPYDVAPDGQRILTLKPVGGDRNSTPLTVLVNWDAGLRRQ